MKSKINRRVKPIICLYMARYEEFVIMFCSINKSGGNEFLRMDDLERIIVYIDKTTYQYLNTPSN